MSYIRTPGGLHLVLNGKAQTLAKTDPVYPKVVEALGRNASDDEVLAIIEAELRRMEEATKVATDIELKGGELFYKGEAIAGTLGIRMKEMLDEGFSLEPMAAFLNNLHNNPSGRVLSRLYDFLEYGKNPITEDGCFLAYKAVREDFRDCHSGKFDNSVGAILEMPRNKVDDRDEHTCSYGFHVCSFDYLASFARSGGHVMICKVNPADVVSIPTDYNNTKMRVCRYEVIGEHEGYYTGEGDSLSATTVAVDEKNPFQVEIQREEDGHWEPMTRHARLVDGATSMEELLGEDYAYAVRLRNTVTDVTLEEKENENFVAPFDDDEPSVLDNDDNGFMLRGVLSNGNLEDIEGEDDYFSAEAAASAAFAYMENYDAVQVVDKATDEVVVTLK